MYEELEIAGEVGFQIVLRLRNERRAQRKDEYNDYVHKEA